ncbi:unnamed protein product [Pylaiella littoralis]
MRKPSYVLLSLLSLLWGCRSLAPSAGIDAAVKASRQAAAGDDPGVLWAAAAAGGPNQQHPSENERRGQGFGVASPVEGERTAFTCVAELPVVVPRRQTFLQERVTARTVPPAAFGDKTDNNAKASVGGSEGFHGSGITGGGGGVGAKGWQFRGRRPRESEAATFFNSLDENADGVLAEDEIREFVGYVGGSTLDDSSEILGGVSRVMGRLDTDSEEGIGLKELSSWINRLGSMLTVEEAADWVTHAVQLPPEVAEAFRSNSISAYDFPELVEDNGAGLYDLGIKRKFRKRIVKAIEVRLLGLGEEPPRPVLHPPSYLGSGKARIEWSAGDAGEGADDVGFIAASSSFVFVDSGLSPGKTYVYRVRAWNLIGHSEAPTAHVTTPPVPSLWKKPWRIISPWWRTGNSSAASLPPSPATETALGDGGKGSVEEERDIGPDGRGVWGWREVFGLACSVAAWLGWGATRMIQLMQAVLVLATLQANLTRLGAAYGRGGTGAAVRRNWAASLVWKVNRVVRRNRFISTSFMAVNNLLERAIGLPPSPHTPPGDGRRGLRRQHQTRDFRGGRLSSSSSHPSSGDISPRVEGEDDDWAGLGLSRIDEDCSGMGVGVYDDGSRRRERSNRYRFSRAGYHAGDGSSASPGGGGRLSRSPSVSPSGVRLQQQHQEYVRHNGVTSRSTQQQQQQRLYHDGERGGVRSRRMGRGESAETSPELNARSTAGAATADGGGGGLPPERRQRWDQDGVQDRHVSGASLASSSPLFSSSSSSSSILVQQQQQQQQQRPPLHPVHPPGSGSGSGNSLGSSFSPTDHSAEWYGDDTGAAAGAASAVADPGRWRRWFGFGWGYQTDPAVAGGAAGTSPGEEAAAAVEILNSRDPRSGEVVDEFVDDRGSSFSGNDDGDDGDGGGRSDDEFPGVGVGVGSGSESGGVGDDGEEDVGGVEMRPTLQRSGSSLQDLRRAMPHFRCRKGSVSRLALGLKKGEASGRDGWRREFDAAEACFSCRKRFKAVTRQRHHCGRCHRVFCSKHGYTPHLKGSVCTIPGKCICDFCLESLGGDGRGGSGGSRGEAAATKDGSEAGAVSVGSGIQSEGAGRKKERRFRWGTSTSFGQLRRIRRAPSDQSANENQSEETVSETDIGGGRGGGTNRFSRENYSIINPAAAPSDTPLPVNSGRAMTASPSADGSSSTTTVHDCRAAAAGGGDYNDPAAAEAAVERPEEFLTDGRRGRRGGGGWRGGLFGARRITR